MPRRSFTSAIAATAAALLLFTTSCDQHAAAPSVRDQLANADKPSTTSQPAQGSNPNAFTVPNLRPVATIDGRAIARKEWLDLLLRSDGIRVLQQLAVREVARGELARRSMTVTPADIDREYNLTLQADRYNGTDPEPLTPMRRDMIIAEWTRTRGVSAEELALAMDRQAALRKLVEDQITITDDQLHEEYDRVHGEKVVVRQMQLGAMRFWAPIKARLEKGEDFTKLVLEFSQNTATRQNGGLLPPFTEHDPTIPAMFVKVAFALKPDEVSKPFEVEGSFSVLKLESRQPPDGAKFEDVRHTLERHLRMRLTAERMETLSAQLYMRAILKIEDPTLRELYRAGHASKQINGPPLTGQ